MRLGIGSFAVAKAIARGEIDHTALMNLAISVAAGSVQYCDNLPLETLPQDAWADLLQKAQDHGIIVEPGTRGIDGDRLARLSELAHAGGSEFVRLVIDTEHDHPTPVETVDRLGAAVARMRPTRLAIENHDRFPAEVLAAMAEELDAAVCLDTANSLGCLEGTEHITHHLAPRTINLHAKDVSVQRVADQMGFTVRGTAAGEGQVDFAWIARQLAPLRQCQSVTVEHWPGDADDEIAWTRRSMSYLRKAVLPSFCG